ncbi:MAG: BrnT family toxin [Nitrospirales bacterium]
MKFSWDPKKAAATLKKHRVSFEEASTVFHDVLSVTGSDPDHSGEEHRFVTFGNSSQGRLLVVAHTDEGETIRIISARLVTRRERGIYEEGES